MLTPSAGGVGARGKADHSGPVLPPFDAEQAAESAAAWESCQGATGVSRGPSDDFYYLDCALSALRTRKLTPVEGMHIVNVNPPIQLST